MLEVKGLRREFADFVAVKDVSLTLAKGEITALLGPNGAGKTTTVKMLAGYLSPTGGEIKIDGIAVANDTKRLQQNVGTVFGGELGFYAKATATQNLQFFANLFNVPRKQRAQRIQEVLQQVDLSAVAEKNVGEFSRGMRQRMHIARALLKDAPILLLDEPMTGLDVEVAAEIRRLIRQVADSGKSILLTSHTMSEVERLADTITLIGGGQSVHTGDVQSVLALAAQVSGELPRDLEAAYLILAPQLRRKER